MIIFDNRHGYVNTESGELIIPKDLNHQFELNRELEYNLDTVMHFGKYKGKTVKQIMLESPTYIYWMRSKGFKVLEQKHTVQMIHNPIDVVPMCGNNVHESFIDKIDHGIADVNVSSMSDCGIY